ncbi:MAG TPA: hypothetical protein VFA89_11510 [Terriglobales bacterium]|nr:hypothetical protein [Terriglobales bacterium]
MASKTVIEYIPGELLQDGKKIYDIKLRLTIKEMMVDELSTPVARAIARRDLMTTNIADGRYTLRYFFDGKKEEPSVRIERGTMLAG